MSFEDDRYRTPSGTIFPPSNDIRSFFESENIVSEKASSLKNLKGSSQPKQQRIPIKRTRRHNKSQPSVKDIVAKHQHSSADINMSKQRIEDQKNSSNCSTAVNSEDDGENAFLQHLASQIGTIPDPPSNDSDSQGTGSDNAMDVESDNRSMHRSVLKASFQRIADKLDQGITTMAQAVNTTEQVPQVMDVSTVIQMFQEIKSEITSAVAKISESDYKDF